MLLNKKVLLILMVVSLFFVTSCDKKDKNLENSDSKTQRGAKPETGLKPVGPLSLKYNFENISDGQIYDFDANIEIELKIIPVPAELDKFIEIFADLSFTVNLKKTGISESGIGFFDFKISKLSVNIPGPGINVDYNSIDKEKFLNPQIKGLDFFVGKDIPVKISRSGKIELDEIDFLDKNEELKPLFKKEYIDQVKVIIGYFFINYPESEIKIEKPFTSDIPFRGEYIIESSTKTGDEILITPEKSISADKNVLFSSIKGWYFVNKNSGIMRKTFLQLIEKKYMEGVDVKSLVEKKILIDIKAIDK